MNQYDAAVAAGFSESYAKRCQLDKQVCKDMRGLLSRRGLTDKYLANHAMEGIAQPDWRIKVKYFELILKMTGRMVDKVEHSGIGETKVNVFPTKTVIFRDININENESADRNLHEPESPAGSLSEGEIQSP